MAKDNNMMVDILVFLLTISYCTGMCFVYYIILGSIVYCYLLYACSCSPYAFVCIYAFWCRKMNVSFSSNTTGEATPT